VQRRLDELIEKLTRVLDAMGEVGTINQLITALREITKQEHDIGEILKKMQDEVRRAVLERIGG
jgi:cob(I)alamin adenosyltransferase